MSDRGTITTASCVCARVCVCRWSRTFRTSTRARECWRGCTPTYRTRWDHGAQSHCGALHCKAYVASPSAGTCHPSHDARHMMSVTQQPPRGVHSASRVEGRHEMLLFTLKTINVQRTMVFSYEWRVVRLSWHLPSRIAGLRFISVLRRKWSDKALFINYGCVSPSRDKRMRNTHWSTSLNWIKHDLIIGLGFSTSESLYRCNFFSK